MLSLVLRNWFSVSLNFPGPAIMISNESWRLTSTTEKQLLRGYPN